MFRSHANLHLKSSIKITNGTGIEMPTLYERLNKLIKIKYPGEIVTAHGRIDTVLVEYFDRSLSTKLNRNKDVRRA